MLRRASDLVKKIYEKRGSIPSIVSDDDSSPRPGNVDILESREEHLVDHKINLDRPSPEIQTVSSQSRHACLVGGAKVLAELSRGGL